MHLISVFAGLIEWLVAKIVLKVRGIDKVSAGRRRQDGCRESSDFKGGILSKIPNRTLEIVKSGPVLLVAKGEGFIVTKMAIKCHGFNKVMRARSAVSTCGENLENRLAGRVARVFRTILFSI